MQEIGQKEGEAAEGRGGIPGTQGKSLFCPVGGCLCGGFFLRKRRYERAKPQERVYRLKRVIYYALELRGIHARLGCDTEETDEEIARQIREVIVGEYKRVCEILEKSYYGDVEPEIYEERTLGLFLKKLVFSGQGLSPGKRFRLKYGFLKIPQAMERKSGQV